ncbi:MAG: YkvA family protein [Pseudomonadota bacterium]
MELGQLRSEQPIALPVAYAPPDEKRFWRKVRRVLARIPFAEDLVAAYHCAMDRDTPAYVRAVLFGALAYFVLPADLVPDMLAGLGFTDDASVIAAAIAAVGRHLEPKHREQARRSLERMAS